MDAYLQHLPAILLIAKDQQDRVPATEWLKQSRFRMWEAMNVFDALEGMTDFTLKNRPDVVVLNVDSLVLDFDLVVELLLDGRANEPEFPIFALSNGNRVSTSCRDVFEGNFDQIKAKLEMLVPDKFISSRSDASRTN
jgi:hypothetical protein